MNKEILRLAIPNVIANITVPLLGMIDMSIVGHLESDQYIGAIAISTMIFNFIYWNFVFLRMGTSGFTAQAFGRKDRQEIINILLRSLSISFIIALFIIIFQQAIFTFALDLIGGSVAVKNHASSFFHIYVWAAPAILGIYTLTGWFIGMQDAKTPMYLAIAVNIINISLSLIFVYSFNMGLKGVALGSMLAQIIGFTIGLIIWYIKHQSYINLVKMNELLKWNNYKAFFKVNTNIFVRTLALVLVTSFFTSASAQLGDIYLAVNSLLMQLFILFSYMMDGFAYAGEALAGKYIGELKPKKLNLLIKKLFLLGGITMVIFTITYGIFTDTILAILTNKENIIEACKEYQTWVLLIPIAGFSAFLWDGIFVGATASRQMRNSMLIATCSFFIIYYTSQSILGNDALWFAFITYLSMRGITQFYMFKKIKTTLHLTI